MHLAKTSCPHRWRETLLNKISLDKAFYKIDFQVVGEYDIYEEHIFLEYSLQTMFPDCTDIKYFILLNNVFMRI